jgi:hypothetical protein
MRFLRGLSKRKDGWVQSKNFPEKYNRSTMANAHQLQCKALRGREKSRRSRNNAEQWKKTMRRTIETVGKSGRVLTSGWTPEDRATTRRASRVTMKKPADEQWRATLAQIRD